MRHAAPLAVWLWHAVASWLQGCFSSSCVAPSLHSQWALRLVVRRRPRYAEMKRPALTLSTQCCAAGPATVQPEARLVGGRPEDSILLLWQEAAQHVAHLRGAQAQHTAGG